MHRGAKSIARSSLCFLLVGFLAALAGCGGGNASSTVPALALSPAAAKSAASPTPLPSTYPLGNGETLVYAGKLTQTFQSFPEVVPPGTPSPEPISVTKLKVSQKISVRTNQSFNGGSGLADLHDAEIDADISGLETTTSTTDTYETATSSQLANYGSKYVDESGDSMTVSYAPQRIEDELPEKGGAQWTNGAGASVLEAIAGDKRGSPVTVSRTVHGDGTYSESTTYPKGYSAPGYTGVGQIQENTDGSGSYAFVANGSAITIEYSQPVPQPTGPPLIKIAEYAQLDPTASSTPELLGSLPAWYGTAPPFYNEIDRDLGTVAVPADCKLRARFPKSATEIQETIDTTDTVLGYTEEEVETNYVAARYGVLCSRLQDTQSLYYDFNGDQPFVFSLIPPLEITKVSETLALQPSSTLVRSTSSRSAFAQSIAPAVAPALRAGFERSVEAARRRRAERIMRVLLTSRLRGVSR